MKNNMWIKKIPLEDLISILVRLYDSGANFIDLKGNGGENQDMIQINVREEYMEEQSSSLSEDDFNRLII